MSVTMSLKDRISAPLEAGATIADGCQLPSRLNTALEYASKKLVRKGVSVTLLVIQKDYQLPTSPIHSPSTASATAYTPSGLDSTVSSATTTPARPNFAASTFSSLKQFIRSSTSSEPPIRERIVHVGLDHLHNDMVSPAFSDYSNSSTSTASTASTASTFDSTFSRQQLRWPASPALSSVPLTPATPFTIVSSTTDTGSAVSGPGLHSTGQFGAKLVYAGTVSPREERLISQTIEKTARKFKIGADWLPVAVTPAALGIPADLINRSRTQNEVLFSSESLTLLSLDHLYTFQAALQSYARTQASSRLEDAVDELRRLILANGRRKLLKSSLVTSYRWLAPVNDTALEDVCRMYGRAYGGLDGEAGVENDMDTTPTSERQPVELPASECSGSDDERPRTSPSFVGTPHPLRGSMTFDRWASDGKELLECPWNAEAEEEDEIYAIEAWYRDVQLQPTEIYIEQPPTEAPSVMKKPPQPPPPPQPQPEIRIDSPSSLMRDTTPKLSTPPPGRSLALRLQTTFEKPKPKASPQPQPQHIIRLEYEHDDDMTARPLSAIVALQQSQHLPPPPPLPHQHLTVRHEIEADEDLTARPISAVAIRPPWMRWGPMSIEGVMRGDSTPVQAVSGARLGGNEMSPISPRQQHPGPLTPNGYDDISPITRGEWGFLMVSGQPKTARVEMCQWER